MQFLFPIRPKLFKHVRKRVGGDRDGYLFHVIVEVAGIGGVVEIRDSSSSSITHPLGVIEAPVPPISAVHDDPRECITGPAPFAAGSSPKIPRVLVEQRRKNTLCQNVSDGLIAISRAVTLPVAFEPLTERRILIVQL